MNQTIDDSASFFTKQERLERYRKVLERFSSNKLAGFGKPEWRLEVTDPCVYLCEPSLQWMDGYGQIDLDCVHLDFPEWYSRKPDFRERDGYCMSHITHGWASWWHYRDNNFEHIIKWLKNAIEITEDSIIRDYNQTVFGRD